MFTPLQSVTRTPTQPANQMILYGLMVCVPLRSAVTGDITDGVLVDLNERALSDFGQPRQQLIGQPITVLLGLEPSGRLLHQLAQVAESGASSRFEAQFRFPGSETPEDYDVQLTPFEGRVLINYYPLARDQPDQTQPQPDHLSALVQNALTGLTCLEPVHDASGVIIDFRYLLVNQHAIQLARKSAEQLLGHRMLELYPTIQGSLLFRKWLEAYQTGQPTQFLNSFTLPNGQTRWYESRTVRYSDVLIESFNDVTEQKQRELQQHDQAALLERVLNTTQSAILVLRPELSETGDLLDLQVTLANQTARHWFNLSALDRMTQTFMPIGMAVSGNAFFDVCQRVLQSGMPERTIFSFGNRQYDMAIAPLNYSLTISAFDVTDLQTQREQLEISNFDLRRSGENLRQFAQVASGDLITPLRKILSFTELMQQQYSDKLPPDGIDVLRRVQTAARRMDMFLHDLLAYSRLSAQTQHMESFELSALINELATEDLWPLIHQSGARLTIGQLPVLTANRAQIRQLLLNLLTNALTFRRAGITPEIEIRARLIPYTELPNVAIQTTGQAEPTGTALYHEISVSDNGTGFEGTSDEQVFQAFLRLKSRSRHDGSGIGLAICRRIVENHRGYISAVGEPGVGATFRIFLPAIETS
ncbi:PAS domain-containing protein [Rudanella paleaurantiibacter]|uniref:histidine kinase n=1 Tax=Rudanella paleaurantiibacter TaxID=2614655 RepID=A0A7J5U0X4_9BACT|nr:PAS domain-containing protein [Rudanella paleaurantiibacter]KAB7731413.1 PAS domain-containing protein [Rudanella paleaurantiibacter]